MGHTDLLVGMTLIATDFAIMEHRGVLAVVSFVAADFAMIVTTRRYRLRVYMMDGIARGETGPLLDRRYGNGFRILNLNGRLFT